MISLINRLKSKKGFTIIELVVVMAIMGVILAMVLPTVFTSDKPAKANALAKDFFYKAQDAMCVSKIANPKAFGTSKSLTFYVDLNDNDKDGKIDFTTGILSGTSLGTAYDGSLDDDFDKTINRFLSCCKNYFVDVQGMEGIVFVKVDNNFAVQSCYWIGVNSTQYAAISNKTLSQDNVVDNYYCGAYPASLAFSGSTFLVNIKP